MRECLLTHAFLLYCVAERCVTASMTAVVLTPENVLHAASACIHPLTLRGMACAACWTICQSENGAEAQICFSASSRLALGAHAWRTSDGWPCSSCCDAAGSVQDLTGYALCMLLDDEGSKLLMALTLAGDS